MDGGAWWAAVHGFAEGRTWLSDFTFTFHFHALEKEMATHSSVLAWRIPGMGKPGGLPPMGSHRVRHDWSDLAAASTCWMKVFFCLIQYFRLVLIQAVLLFLYNCQKEALMARISMDPFCLSSISHLATCHDSWCILMSRQLVSERHPC